MKKAIVALTLVLSIGLGGCSGAGGQTQQPAQSGAPTAPAQTAQPGNEPVKISFGGSSSSSSAYVIGVAYGEIVNNNLSNVILTVEETTGGNELMDLLRDGEISAGAASDVPAYSAYNGINDFEGDSHDDCVRGWLPMYISETQIVVLADSDIRCVSDLAGKKVNIDQVGRGGELVNREMLGFLGLYDKIQVFNVSMKESMEMLKTGEIDAAIVGTSAPASTIVELGTSTQFRIVPFSEEEIALITSSRPYYFKGSIPAGTYDAVTEEVPTIVKYTSAYIHPDVNEQVVYDMTKAIWEHQERLVAAHPSQENLSAEMVQRLANVMEMHPGAKRYFTEIGCLG